MEHKWVQPTSASIIPDNSVEGGYDINKAKIYVGRAIHEGVMLPAKVLPSLSCALVGWNMHEEQKSVFDMLVGEGYDWVKCADGNVPANAVSTGKTDFGEPLYIGRGLHKHGGWTTLCVGKVQPSHRCLYIPFNNKEVRLNSYEVLIRQHTWLDGKSFSRDTKNVVWGGYDIDKAFIYVGRAMHEGVMLPAKVILRRNCALVGWNMCEYVKSEFEMLVGQGYDWVPCADSYVPPNAVSTGKTHTGEFVYIGRGYYKEGEKDTLCVGRVQPSHRCLYIPFGNKEKCLSFYEVLVAEYKWVHSTSSKKIPDNAVLGGYDIDDMEIYVGRALHENEMRPAKVFPIIGTALVGWNMREYIKSDFEMLVGKNYDWVECADGQVPPNAVSTGNAGSGEPLYIGRGSHMMKGRKTLCVGRVDLSNRCLYIPFNRQELRVNPYQVLIIKHTWVHSTLPLKIPSNAVLGGHDINGEKIYVGRVFHNNELLPATVKLSAGFALVGWNMREDQKSEFEMLVGQGYEWVPCTNGYVPPNAVSTGITRSGEFVYIGRGCHKEGEKTTLCVGRVDLSHRCLYIPFGRREMRLNPYEVLICNP